MIPALAALLAMLLGPAASQDLDALQQRVREGDLLQVVEELSRVPEPSLPVLQNLAFFQQYSGDFAGCQRTLDQILRQDPGNTAALRDRAAVAWREGRLDRALAGYRQLEGIVQRRGPTQELEAVRRDVAAVREEIDQLEPVRDSLRTVRKLFVAGLVAALVLGIAALWPGLLRLRL